MKISKQDAEKIASSTGAPKHGPIWYRIVELIGTLNYKEDTLRSQSRNIRNTVERVEGVLDSPRSVVDSYSGLNDLGELQSRGPAYDVEIAKYCEIRGQISELIDIAKRTYHKASAE